MLKNLLITPVDRRFVFAQIGAHLKVFHDRHVGKDLPALRHMDDAQFDEIFRGHFVDTLDSELDFAAADPLQPAYGV